MSNKWEISTSYSKPLLIYTSIIIRTGKQLFGCYHTIPYHVRLIRLDKMQEIQLVSDETKITR